MKDLLIKNRKLLLWLLLAVILFCIFLGNNFLNLIDNKREQGRLTKHSVQLDKEYEELQTQLQLLKDQDPVYIEKVARVEYNMSAPDEIEYRFETK